MNTLLAIDIANRIAATEREEAHRLGHDAIDCFLLSRLAWGDAFNIATGPDRPAVHLDPRMVENRTR